MELDFEDIHFIVEKSMEAAQLATVLALEPAGALLRTYKKFLELVERGVSRGNRRGKAKNSHVYYNKSDIKKAFAEVEIMQRLAEAQIRRR